MKHIPFSSGRRRAALMPLAAALASGAMALGAAGPSAAADGAYPQKPIRLIVSYPAGGSVDVSARILQQRMSEELGQTVVVENRGGAGGTIGSDVVAKAEPDGYTLLITLSSHTINPAIYPKLPFDTAKDFAPVTLVASAPQILVANPSFPGNNINDIVELAKKSPNGLHYGSAGTGSPSHIAGELLKLKTGANLNHVPYRGGGPAVIDVMGNQIPLLWVSLPAVAGHVKEGKLKAIAVSTAKRSPLLPDVPAVGESVPGFEVDSWYAIFAPAGTPAPIIDKVQQVVAKLAKEPKIQQDFQAQGAVVVGGTPQELDKMVQRELKDWKDLAKQADIKME